MIPEYHLSQRMMEVYFVSFHSNKIHGIVEDIKTLFDGVGRISIKTCLDLHTQDRQTPEDYKIKVAFSIVPKTKNVYQLGELPVYIDDSYTSMYFTYPLDFFCIVKKNLLVPNAFNAIKSLLPKPEKVFNPRTIGFSESELKKGVGKVYVDTADKEPMFDDSDLF